MKTELPFVYAIVALCLIIFWLPSCVRSPSEPIVLTVTSVEDEPTRTRSPEPTATEIVIELVPTETPEPPETVDLRWKLPEEGYLAFKTSLLSADSTLNLQPDELFAVGDLSDPLITTDRLNELLFELPQEYDLLSVIQDNGRGALDVKLILDEFGLTGTAPEAIDPVPSMIQLRGAVTPAGEVDSFYLVRDQVNLVALYFELPAEPVAVGDRWEIDFNCISTANGFVAESSSRQHLVELVAIEENDQGGPIAVIRYAIVERVAGQFQDATFGLADDQSIECVYIGEGRFSIEDGRWEQLVGQLSIEMIGLNELNSVQTVALEPLDRLPAAYLDLE